MPTADLERVVQAARAWEMERFGETKIDGIFHPVPEFELIQPTAEEDFEVTSSHRDYASLRRGVDFMRIFVVAPSPDRAYLIRNKTILVIGNFKTHYTVSGYVRVRRAVLALDLTRTEQSREIKHYYDRSPTQKAKDSYLAANLNRLVNILANAGAFDNGDALSVVSSIADDPCPICLGDVNAHTPVTLVCGHRIHAECRRGLVECPMCRHAI